MQIEAEMFASDVGSGSESIKRQKNNKNFVASGTSPISLLPFK